MIAVCAEDFVCGLLDFILNISYKMFSLAQSGNAVINILFLFVYLFHLFLAKCNKRKRAVCTLPQAFTTSSNAMKHTETELFVQ